MSNKDPSSKQISIKEVENNPSSQAPNNNSDKETKEQIQVSACVKAPDEKSKEVLPSINSRIENTEMNQKSVKEISNELLCKDFKEVSKTFTQSGKSEKRRKNGSKKNRKGKKTKSSKWVY